MSEAVIHVSSHVDGVKHLQICRPDVLNALNRDVCESLISAMATLERDRDTGEGETKVLVVSGQGPRAFCSGADLTHMRSLSGADLRRFIELTWTALDSLSRTPIITIAALHGYTLGGGAELALACDLRVADTSLQMGFPEMTLGSLPGSGGMQRLPRIIGRSAALELVCLGTRLTSDQAKDLGLVNRIAKEKSVLEEALSLGEEIAQRPAESLRYAKLSMQAEEDPHMAGALHGLISSVCQADPSYRTNTTRFDNE